MGGAAVGEELGWIGVGAKPDVLDLGDPRLPKARHHVAGEIEQGVASTRRGDEVARVARIVSQKTIDQLLADLVIRLADHWAGRRHDPVADRAERLHRGDRRLDYA